MKRKIEFRFSGHTGSWAAIPLECPIKCEVCACGTMSFKKEWLVYREVGKRYKVCVHFTALGPDVPAEGTSNSFPAVVICGR